jgi:hypothetical protein
MYRNYFVQLGLSAIAMFLAMYAMIASLQHFVFNLNTIYMTLLMVAPMAVIMLLFMREMYKDRRTNMLIIAGSVLVFLLSLWGIRTQTPIGDTGLVRDDPAPFGRSLDVRAGQALRPRDPTFV